MFNSELITRVASLSTTYLDLMRFSNTYSNKIEKYIKFYKELENVSASLEKQLFEIIKSEKGDKNIIKIKRKIVKNKYIEKHELEYLLYKMKEEKYLTMDYYNFLILELSHIKHYCHEKFDKEYTVSKKNLKRILNKTFLYNGLILSSRSIRKDLKRYQLSKKNSIERLDNTYINYLYRSIMKPSPFGSFTIIGCSSESDKAKTIEINEKTVVVDVRINYIILKMIFEALSKRKIFKENLFVSEAEIININEKNIKLMIEKNKYNKKKYQEKVIKVNQSPFLVEILNLFKDGPIKYAKASEKINNIITNKQGMEYLERLIDDGIIELRFPFNNSDPDLLFKTIEFLQSNESIQSENIKIINQLIEIKTTIQKMENISDARRPKYISHIEAIVKDIYFDLNIEHTMKNVIYEDYYFKEKLPDNMKYIIENNLETFKLIKNLCFLFDQKYTIRTWTKDLYLNFFNENKHVNIIDFFTAYNKLLKKFNSQDTMNQKLEFNPFNNQNINDLSAIRKHFIKTIIKSENDDSIIHLNSKDLKYLGKKIENIIRSNTNKRAYYIQCIDNEKIIINNILDGSGHYTTRFMNAKSKIPWQEEMFSNMKHKKPKNAIELLNSYYFNANVHYPLSNFGIGYRQNVNDLVNPINFKYLTIRYCEKKDELYIYSEYHKDKFNIYDLGFLTEEMKPALYNFLSLFTQNSNLSPAIFLKKYINWDNEIVFMPRLVIDKVVLSRKKWSFKKEVVKVYLKKEKFLELLLFFEKNNMPKQFFFKYYTNKWTKPKYIDLYSPMSFIAFIREVNNLEERTVITINETLPEPNKNNNQIKETIFEI